MLMADNTECNVGVHESDHDVTNPDDIWHGDPLWVDQPWKSLEGDSLHSLLALQAG